MSRTGIRKSRRRNRSDRVHIRQLGIEPLESRRLLTLAEFHINLYEDVEGTPGAAIGAVSAGDTFFLEISAEDVQPDPLGLHGVSLDIRWNPEIFAVADPFSVADVVTDSLPLFAFGTLEPEVGRINDLTGSAGLALGAGELVGLHGPETFALIRFEALQAAEESQFALRGGKYGIAFFPPIWDQPSDFYFDQQSVSVAVPIQELPAEATPEVSALSLPDVGPATSIADAAASIDEGISIPATNEASTESVIATPDNQLTTEVAHREIIIADTSIATEEATLDAIIESTDVGEATTTGPVVQMDTPDTLGQDPTTTVEELLELQSGEPATIGSTDQSSALDAADTLDQASDTTVLVVLSEVPFFGREHASGREAVEGEGQADEVSSSNACVATPRRRANFSSTRPSVLRRLVQARVRSLLFVGPLLPHEYATQLILAQPPNQLTSLVVPNQLHDDLADLLATDANSPISHPTP